MLNYKGKTLCNLGRYEESLECFEKVIEFDPENKHALAGKYLTLRKLGRNKEARDLSFKAVGSNIFKK